MQQTKKIDNKVISNRFFNSYSLHMERANDLETLCRLREYNMTGYRNMAGVNIPRSIIKKYNEEAKRIVAEPVIESCSEPELEEDIFPHGRF